MDDKMIKELISENKKLRKEITSFKVLLSDVGVAIQKYLGHAPAPMQLQQQALFSDSDVSDDESDEEEEEDQIEM